MGSRCHRREAHGLRNHENGSGSCGAGGKPALRCNALRDVSHLLNHTHTDEPFDDFARQPLLPKRLSQLGPGVSWFDLNGDGWEDLIIGSGKGGRLATF